MAQGPRYESAPDCQLAARDRNAEAWRMRERIQALVRDKLVAWFSESRERWLTAGCPDCDAIREIADRFDISEREIEERGLELRRGDVSNE